MVSDFRERRRSEDEHWKSLENFIEHKFLEHEKVEMLMATRIQEILTRHDLLLVGATGANGLVGDMKGIKTKLAIFASIGGALVAIAGVLVAL